MWNQKHGTAWLKYYYMSSTSNHTQYASHEGRENRERSKNPHHGGGLEQHENRIAMPFSKIVERAMFRSTQRRYHISMKLRAERLMLLISVIPRHLGIQLSSISA
jgi:hypothetical protein